MKNSIGLVLVGLFVFAGCTTPGPQVSGNYLGQWTNNDGNSGDVRVSLNKSDAGTWKADAAVSYDGNDIPVTMESVKVDGIKVEISYAGFWPGWQPDCRRSLRCVRISSWGSQGIARSTRFMI